MLVKQSSQQGAIGYPLFVVHLIHSFETGLFSFLLEVYRLPAPCCWLAWLRVGETTPVMRSENHTHTLSSTSISRNLYIESSLVFCFLVVCQIGAFLSFFSPLWLK